jgi:D-alanyl-D-alanine carboxypeptidase
MVQTSFPLARKTIRGSHSHGYLSDQEGALLDATTEFSPSWAWSAGALISNAPDVAALYRGVLGGDLLEPDLLAEMKETVPAGEGLGYGLGLLTLELPCGTAYGHNGIFFGYFTFALTTEDGSRQAVVMTNVDVLNGQPPSGVEAAAMEALAAGLCGSG